MSDALQEPPGVPEDVAVIRREIRRFLDSTASNKKKIGNAKFGGILRTSVPIASFR